jgi:threonine/homoserine efflux transporter RhtA
VKRVLLGVLIAAALVVPSGLAWRTPTLQEYRLVVKALPPSYHQSCIRYSVRVSTVDRRFAAVFFRFVRARGPCRPFDGQVLMKRLTPTRWTKIGGGSSWPCRVRGVPTHVVRDLFGGCAP